MRRISAWMLLVIAGFIGGLTYFTPAGAADVSDDEFKAMLEQDTKIINDAVAAVDKATGKDKKVVEKNASSGVKSSALLIAGYANSRIDGKNANADGMAASVRDTALKMYKAADAKDFKAVSAAATDLARPKAVAGAKKVDLAAAIKDLGEVSQKEVMHNFLKKEQYGTNIEADIIANAKKATAKSADINLMTKRLLVMADYNKIVVKPESAADKKSWADYNEKMIKAVEGLQATTKKKTSAADLAKAFTAVDGSCKACHDDFK
jgi:hypothetical protein